MKNIRVIAVSLILGSLAAPLHAASKPDVTPDWSVVAKANEGKKITLPVNETGDTGAIASDAAYAVVPVTALNAANREYPQVPVLMAPDKVAEFLKSVQPKKTAKRGVFGAKTDQGTFTGTFVTVMGEYALVYGDVKPAMKLKKPSEVLATQLAAAKESPGQTKPAPVPAKPAKAVR